MADARSAPSAAAPAVKLVAGLGNPGREYEKTRHNVGFLVLDRLASRERADWSFSSAWQAFWTRGPGGIYFLKPQTYMNHSGRSVRSFSQYYKIVPGAILVVYDDLALPIGQLRLRREGSSGGQNGMQSILECLDTSAVPRLRVGIGGLRPGQGMVGHVLGEFSRSEQPGVDEAIERGADAVEHVCRDGLEPAMNTFNRSPAAQKRAEG